MNPERLNIRRMPGVENAALALKVMSEIQTHPSQDLSAIASRYVRSEAMFSEINDEGDPPAFIGVSHRDFPFDFESVLGFYNADERRITCFPKGIAFVADALKVDSVLVERIVRYHEHAHALHHLGIAKANPLPEEAAKALRSNDESYRVAPDDTKEQIAQLATLVVIRTRRQAVSSPDAQKLLDKMLDAFFALMQRQSQRYRLPSETRDGDLARLRDKLRLLFDMSDASVFPSADHIKRIIS